MDGPGRAIGLCGEAPGAHGFFTIALGILIAGAAVCGGCATRIVPPAHVADPVTAYVTDYGRHASLVLPTGPDTLTEYAFGDWTFFAEAKDTLPNGIAALFCSRGSGFGRRSVADPHDPARLGESMRATVKGFQVDRKAAARLASKLDARYLAHVDTEIYNSRDQIYFVKDPEHYGLFNNSNQLTARWLRELGCEVRGPALLSNFVVEARGGGTQ